MSRSIMGKFQNLIECLSTLLVSVLSVHSLCVCVCACVRVCVCGIVFIVID